jgi:release factor glutamine methyltransferase
LDGSINIRLGDLFSVLHNNEKFDVIIFNPPYLPIQKEDILDNNDWINIATDGGIDGLKIIKRFIINVKKYLKNEGKAYFIFSSLSDRNKLNNYLENNDLKSNIVSSQKYDDEIIDVYVLSN